MDKQTLWQYFVDKNPAFRKSDDETISISIKNLRKLSNISFEEGKKEGFEGGIAANKHSEDLNKKNKSSSDFNSIFGNIFDKKI
jgi:hypothetical protein